MPATVKRAKVLHAPPSLCSGCYWQTLATFLRDENRQLRKDLLKARAAEKRPKTAIKKLVEAIHDDHEPMQPGRHHDQEHEQLDLVDFIHKGRL